MRNTCNTRLPQAMEDVISSISISIGISTNHSSDFNNKNVINNSIKLQQLHSRLLIIWYILIKHFNSIHFLLCFSTSDFSFLYLLVRYTINHVNPAHHSTADIQQWQNVWQIPCNVTQRSAMHHCLHSSHR